MKLEFRTKNTAYGNAHYLCIDTDAKTFSRVPDGWVSKDVPVVAKRDMDTLKAQAIADGYTEVYTMTKKDRVQIVENAINEYLTAKRSGNADAIKTTINGMENIYIAVCNYNVPGTEALRELIQEVR